MTYVRKSDIDGEPELNTSKFPIDLDEPNDPNRPIITYEGYPYSN
jgi:hypothetical protein